MNRILQLSTCLTILFSLATSSWGQVRITESPLPKYPRVNRTPRYAVDPQWPQWPEKVERAAVTGIAVDAEENVWVYNRSKLPVQVYTCDGKYLRGWGADQVGLAHQMTIGPEGSIWLSDIGIHTIRKFSPDGKILLTLGIPGEFGEDERRLSQPTDVVVTKQGDIFVADGYGNNRIVHYSANGQFVKQWGQMGTEPGEFCNPHAIAVDSQGRLYVVDRYNGRVQVFSQAGEVLDVWEHVMIPWGIWITPEDDIWICGSSPDAWPDDPKINLGGKPRDQLFLKFNTSGKLTQLWSVPLGGDETSPGELNLVHCIALDKSGNIYTGDILGKRAQKFVMQK